LIFHKKFDNIVIGCRSGGFFNEEDGFLIASDADTLFCATSCCHPSAISYYVVALSLDHDLLSRLCRNQGGPGTAVGHLIKVALSFQIVFFLSSHGFPHWRGLVWLKSRDASSIRTRAVNLPFLVMVPPQSEDDYCELKTSVDCGSFVRS
jgi:hypothetical protein